jgi:hypothetical protein
MYSAAALLLGVGLGLWLKSWRVVLALVLVGLAVSIVGWQAGWFGDVDTGGDFTAGGGAFVFWLFACLPLAVGAALAVSVARSGGRRRRDVDSTLPVIAPPGEKRPTQSSSGESAAPFYRRTQKRPL